MGRSITITDVHAYPLIFAGDTTNEYPVACPMSVYPAYRASRQLWRDDFGPLIVKIETDAGIEGIGYTSMGSVICALSIELHLKRLLIGEDPRRVERLNDILIRSTYHQGRDGYLMHAISALDLALVGYQRQRRGPERLPTAGRPDSGKHPLLYDGLR